MRLLLLLLLPLLLVVALVVVDAVLELLLPGRFSNSDKDDEVRVE